MHNSSPIITSLQNQRVRRVLALRNRKERDTEKLAIIEGLRQIQRAETAGMEMLHVYYCEQLCSGSEILEYIKHLHKIGSLPWRCNEAVFRKLAYCEHPDGILAITRQRHLALEKLEISSNPLLLVAVNLEKPGNLGAMLRTADAAGVEAVLVCDPNTDIYNPNVIRSSLGLVFTMQVAQTDSEIARSWLRKNKIRTLAASPHAEVDYCKTDCNGPLAVIVGAESDGLCKEWIRGADIVVKIPMRGKGDSLNVSVAAGILIFEAIRQRNR